MDDAYDVPDSTDWLNTPLKDLAALENSLHCQICKEFYDTPMITTCNHTFCSKCIRTSLSADGKCPTCRASDQANKLRNNWALQEVVTSFLAARPNTLEVARKAQQETEVATLNRPGKRKRNAVLGSDEVIEAGNSSRTTRSKSRRIAASQDSQPETIEVDESEDEAEHPAGDPPAEDGLVECPLGCGKRMKEEQVFGHLDKCEDEQKQAKKAKSRTTGDGATSSRQTSSQNTRPQDRINELNYSMMKDSALSKKLKDIGIPNFGSKLLMTNRHKEWVNIWNANCDSNSPRSRRDLIRDLDTWERTQGGRAPNANGISSTIMRKDFDGDAYLRRHQDEFSRLIADAKRKKNVPPPTKSPTKDIEVPDSDAETAEGDTSPFFATISNADGDGPSRNDAPATGSLSTIESKPYENNIEAISSIRQKVEAVNRGDEIKPLMNEGFKIPETEIPGDSPPRRPAVASGKTQIETQDQSTHGISLTREVSDVGSDGRSRSRDEHIVHNKTGSPCDIASHLDLDTPNRPRRVPMFEVPQQQIGDVDGATAGG